MPYPVAAVRNKNFGNLLYGDLVMSLGPIAYWPLNDLSGSAAVNLVDAGLNGTYTACTLGRTQAPFVAPLFDGTSGRASVYSAGLAALTGMLSEGSAMVWVKVYDAGAWTDSQIRRGIYLYTATAADGISIAKNNTSNTISFAHKLSGTTVSVNTGGQSSIGWICLAATFSETSAEFKAYLNGAQTGATQAITSALSANPFANGACFIGAFNSTPSQPWYGWLAHVALWNRPLTPTEVGNLYAWGL